MPSTWRHGNPTNPQVNPVQVGTNTTWNAVSTGGNHACATRSDSSVWCWGNNTRGQLGLGNTVSPQTTPVRVGTGTVLGVFASDQGDATFTLTND